jgi:aspartate carbamoyltransferase catalytic subunit
MKHLIDPMDLTKEEQDQIVTLAGDIIDHREKYRDSQRYHKLATLFYEPSTRTRLSFTAAMLELGGKVLGFDDAKSSSVSKGESVQDTVRVVGCFADVIAMRHHIEGAQLYAAEVSRVPIINAGDGSHSHPTQTLTDLVTIQRELGHIDGITIGFCGDLKFGRTVHSLIQALSRYENVRLVLISPDELKLPEYVYSDVIVKNKMKCTQTSDLQWALPKLDVLYMPRVQKERFFNEEDYLRLKDSYILTPEKLAFAKPDTSVLHPLPRVNEISVAIDDDPRACYFKQVKYGKYMRMALILKLLSEDGAIRY